MQEPMWNTSDRGKIVRRIISCAKSRRKKTAMETKPQSAIAIDSSMGKSPILGPETYVADPCGDSKGGFQKGNSCGGGGSGGTENPEKSSESKAEPKQDAGHVTGKRILPDRPISERLAAYHDGDKKVKALQAIGKENQTFENYQKAIEKNLSERKSLRGKARKDNEKEFHDLLAKSVTAAKNKEKIAAKIREKVHEVLKAKNPIKIEDRSGSISKMPEGHQEAARGAIEFLSKIIERGDEASTDSRWEAIPTTSIQRANCNPQRIALGIGELADVAVHEFGHHLDNHVKGFNEAAIGFLDHRVGDEPLVQLDALGIGSYRPDEKGRKDKFDDAFGDSAYYVGKKYINGTTEITSMGIEKIYKDPVDFATKDPEYAKFIIGLLSGELR